MKVLRITGKKEKSFKTGKKHFNINIKKIQNEKRRKNKLLMKIKRK